MNCFPKWERVVSKVFSFFHGKGVNLGWFFKKDNNEIAQKLRKAFSEWIDNGHNNFDDENTIILCIQLTEGILFSHGTRYDIVFSGN